MPTPLFLSKFSSRLGLLKNSRKSPFRSNSSKTPVLYTMGKVASSALTEALGRSGIPAHQIHNLDTPTLLKLAKRDMDAGRLPLRHICQSMTYRTEYRRHPERFLFISVVRDPIARNMSAFFQNLGISETNGASETADLFETFKTTYPHNLPLVWFDRQFEDALGIDVFQTPFDSTKKYLYMPDQNTLLLRVDCPRTTKEQLLSEIFQRPIYIPKVNVGDKKGYSARYKAFKSHAHFDEPLLDQIYNSKFCRHFWSEQERTEMREMWGNSASG